MNQKKLKKIIRNGESQYIEFKTNFDDSAIKTMVTFANAKGGQIFIGINQKKQITGAKIFSESIQKRLNEIKHKTYPNLIPDYKILTVNNKKIISLNIKEYPLKPISFKAHYYIRKANSNHILNLENAFALYAKTFNLSWDKTLMPKKTIKDLDYTKIEKFIEKLKNHGLKLSDDVITVLNKFNLIEENKITFAADLLFGKKPFNSTIHLVKFKYDDREDVVEDVYFEDDIILAVEKIMDFVKKNIRKGFKKAPADKKLTHDTVLDGIRELIINMIVHRNYKEQSPALIFIYNHKIEFWNHGALPKEITIQAIKNNSYAPQIRNSLIVKIFKELKIIENIGSGLNKVWKIFNKNNINLEISKSEKGTMIILKPKNVPKNIPKKRVRKIIALIQNNNKITIPNLAKKLKVTEKTIKRDIKKLKEKKYYKELKLKKGENEK